MILLPLGSSTVLKYGHKVESAQCKKLPYVGFFLRPHGPVARQALRSMGFSRQEYWRGLPFPSPGVLPNPGLELTSPALKVDS